MSGYSSDMTIPPEPEVRRVEGVKPSESAPPAPRAQRGRARDRAESAVVRIIATCGGVGIVTAVAAILGSQDVSAWLIGLISSLLTLLLVALLWVRTPARRSRV